MSEDASTVSPGGELAKINACAKRPIDIWTNYLYYPLSIRLVYLIRNSRISPNSVTLTSLVLALIGCVFFSIGTRSTQVLGLILVQVSYVFDCADGQLARYRKQYSPIGGWLDQVADRIKEFAVYFSLAYGFTRNHPGNTEIWVLGMLSLFTLYLLEYYGQIHFKPKTDKPATAVQPGAAAVSQAPAADSEDTFSTLQKWRSFIPFRGFIIGEQYFTMLVFVAFGAVLPMFRFVGIVGVLMAVYRPVVQLYKWNRAG